MTKARQLLLDDRLDADDFGPIKAECEEATRELEDILNSTSIAVLLEPQFDKAMSVLSNLFTWQEWHVPRQRALVGSMFPEKLEFDGFTYRTARINEAVRLIFNLARLLAK